MNNGYIKSIGSMGKDISYLTLSALLAFSPSLSHAALNGAAKKKYNEHTTYTQADTTKRKPDLVIRPYTSWGTPYRFTDDIFVENNNPRLSVEKYPFTINKRVLGMAGERWGYIEIYLDRAEETARERIPIPFQAKPYQPPVIKIITKTGELETKIAKEPEKRRARFGTFLKWSSGIGLGVLVGYLILSNGDDDSGLKGGQTDHPGIH